MFTLPFPARETSRLPCRSSQFVKSEADTQYLAIFIEDARQLSGVIAAEAAKATDSGGPAMVSDNHVEIELRDTRGQLQSITEEHETALEELRSPNEELHSVNEELQSANEELETSKEEIQSINEELQTVNAQLSGKVDELGPKNSRPAGTYSRALRSRRSSLGSLSHRARVHARRRGNLQPHSERSRASAHGYRQPPALRADCADDVPPRARRPWSRWSGASSATTSPRHYLMRVLPYRTPENAQ